MHFSIKKFLGFRKVTGTQTFYYLTPMMETEARAHNQTHFYPETQTVIQSIANESYKQPPVGSDQVLSPTLIVFFGSHTFWIWNCRRAIVDLSVRSTHSVQAEAGESPPGSLPMRLTGLSGKRANVEMGGQAYEERRSTEKEVQHLPSCSHTSERSRFSVPHSPTLLSSLGPNHRDLSLWQHSLRWLYKPVIRIRSLS